MLSLSAVVLQIYCVYNYLAKGKLRDPRDRAQYCDPCILSRTSRLKQESLSLKPRSDWLVPFLVGAWLSMALGLALDGQRWPISAGDKFFHCVALLWEAAMSVFIFLVLVPMWVLVRSNGREFFEAVRLRAFLVGAATPAVLIAVAICFEWVQYPQLTRASPGLESQLITFAILGEILVRVCSRAKPEMLGG